MKRGPKRREGEPQLFFREIFRVNAAEAIVFVERAVQPYRRECVHLSTQRAGRGAASEALLAVIFPKRSGFL